MKFILLVGLPGSGKTHYGKSLPYPFFDDLSQNGGIQSLKFSGDTVVISDVNFILYEQRSRAIEILSDKFPVSSFKWIAWENDPESCWHNIQNRNDDRVISKESLYNLSSQYTYPATSIRKVAKY